jgi:hypothetical protein
VSDEAKTASRADRQSQIAELRSLAASGAIDTSEYERRRSQIIAPGAKPSEWRPSDDDWTTPVGRDADGDDEATPETTAQWMIAFVICVVLGGLSGFAIEEDWSGVVIGAVIFGGAMFLIDVLRAS